MSVHQVLLKLQRKLGINLNQMSHLIGLKSSAHIYFLNSGKRRPSRETCYKLIKLGKQLGINVTLDQLIDK